MLAIASGTALALALVRRARRLGTQETRKNDRSKRWNDIYSRKGRLSDAKTPLHVLGGYDMYTLDQWVDAKRHAKVRNHRIDRRISIIM